MTLERISAFITYCIAVLLAWMGDLSLKDASTVGGVLISRLGHQGTWVVVWFLAGFFVAGLFWAAVLCAVGSFGGKVLGENLLRYSYMASAVIFAYFSVYVMVSGYREFFPT